MVVRRLRCVIRGSWIGMLRVVMMRVGVVGRRGHGCAMVRLRSVAQHRSARGQRDGEKTGKSAADESAHEGNPKPVVPQAPAASGAAN